MRPSTEHQRRDLKTMTWSLLNAIGLTAFAPLSRVQVSELSKYGSQNDERSIPIDVLFDAETVAQNPMVTRLLADMHGYRLVPKDAATDGAAAPASIDAVLRAIKEAGDVASVWLSAHADGVCDQKDRRDIRREIDEAITALTELRKGI